MSVVMPVATLKLKMRAEMQLKNRVSRSKIGLRVFSGPLIFTGTTSGATIYSGRKAIIRVSGCHVGATVRGALRFS